MPRKTAALAPVFDISQYREPVQCVTREIPWEDASKEPLRVTLQDLSIRQTNTLVFTAQTPMPDVYAAIAPYVVGWNFRAENLETGDLVDVPPPAELGPEAFELLPNHMATSIYLWLKTPWAMKAADTKKALTPSTSTPDSSSASD